MKNSLQKLRNIIFLGMFVFFGIQTLGKGSGSEVKEKATQAVGSAVEYTQEQKDRFISEMNEKILKIKSEIEELKSHSKEVSQQKIAKLQAEEERIEKQMKDLKRSSGKAWVQVKKGVNKAWDDLRASLKEAQKEFKK